MGAAAPVLMGVSAGLSLYNGYQQSENQKLQGRYEQMAADSNARMADLRADDVDRRGALDANREIGKARRFSGSQRAAYAGQGVDVNSGDPANIVDETGYRGALDAETVKSNAFREAWGYRTQASDYRFSGQYARKASKTQARNTLLTGGFSALGSLGQVAAYARS